MDIVVWESTLNFSLKAYVDILKGFPEHKVIDLILEQYDNPVKGQLFNEKFIPSSELMILGLDGFIKLLYTLLETNEEFLGTCLPELRALTLSLKGDSNYG